MFDQDKLATWYEMLIVVTYCMRLGQTHLISSSFLVSDDKLTLKSRVWVHLLVRAYGLAEQGLPFILCLFTIQ